MPIKHLEVNSPYSEDNTNYEVAAVAAGFYLLVVLSDCLHLLELLFDQNAIDLEFMLLLSKIAAFEEIFHAKCPLHHSFVLLISIVF